MKFGTWDRASLSERRIAVDPSAASWRVGRPMGNDIDFVTRPAGENLRSTNGWARRATFFSAAAARARERRAQDG